MGYYTEKAKEVKARIETEIETYKEALNTVGIETEEEVTDDAE